MRRRSLCYIVALVLCILILVFETSIGNSGPRIRMRGKVLRMEPLVRGNLNANYFDRNLAIVEVLGGNPSRSDYKTAIDSVECYATERGHFLYILRLEEFKDECGQHKDFYYERHCVVHHLMMSTPHHWFVFLDSDMEVVSPNRSFSEYIRPPFEIFLYDRMWNWEIMAGSYIVRGNDYGQRFVKGFANYEFEHPKIANHGTDNGAIQTYVAEGVFGNRSAFIDCWEMWEKSVNWDDMFRQEWCIRKKLGARSDFGKLKIYPKGRGWARDGGLTHGKFCPETDFILHARKEKDRKVWNATNHYQYWYDTRISPIDLEKCRSGAETWEPRKELVMTADALEKNLGRSASGTQHFLEGLFQRINKTEEFEHDKIHHKDVLLWLSSFPNNTIETNN